MLLAQRQSVPCRSNVAICWDDEPVETAHFCPLTHKTFSVAVLSLEEHLKWTADMCFWSLWTYFTLCVCWQSSIWRTTPRTTRGPAPYSSANPRTMVSSCVTVWLTYEFKNWNQRHQVSLSEEETLHNETLEKKKNLQNTQEIPTQSVFFSLWRADVCKFMLLPRRHLTDSSGVLWGVQSHCDGGDINVFLRDINNTAWDRVFYETGGNKQEDKAAFVMFKVADE